MHVRLGSCRRLWRRSHGRAMMVLIIAFLVLLGTLHQPARCATLEELFDGGSLTVANSRFSDWELISLDSTGPTPDLSQIAVVPLSKDWLNPGVQYTANGQLSMTGLGSIDLVFKFRIHALAGGNTFAGESLGLTGITFGRLGGIAYITDSINDSDGDGLASSLVIADNEGGFSQSFATLDFAAQSGVFVVTNAFIAGMSPTDVVQLNSFSQSFAQIGPAVLPGDYNKNGNVDAADHVVWRKNEGTSNLLPNDLIGGTIGAAQYDQWRSHFGQTAGSGAAGYHLGASAESLSAAVPEPASALIYSLWAALLAWMRRRVASRVPTTR